MQAVILAAGKGTRMLPLTLTTPKPMLLVSGRPILEHIIDALPKEISEVILVVGYLEKVIRTHFGDTYKGRTIRYVTQVEQKGTFLALKTAEPLITGKFLLLNADDLHGAAALAAASEFPLALIVARHHEPTKFGVVVKNPDGTLHDILEKPEVAPDNLVSTGAMVLDRRIFDYEEAYEGPGEYYITYAIHKLAQEHPMVVVEQPEWIAIGYPEDLAKAEQILAEDQAAPVEEGGEA